jgi:hypothetical protein
MISGQLSMGDLQRWLRGKDLRWVSALRSSKPPATVPKAASSIGDRELRQPKIDADLERAILADLRKKDRPGLRVIAAEHGVAVNTVRRIAAQ